MELLGSEISNISANLNETLVSSGQPTLSKVELLKNMHVKDLNRLIFVHFNTNLIRNIFNVLVTKVNNNIDGFLILETKIGSSFLTS